MANNTSTLPTEEEVNKFDMVSDLLGALKKELVTFSNKKPNENLNPMKIKMVNRVLIPLKEILKNEDTQEYLDTLTEEDLPTYSDTMLVISQYEAAIKKYKNKYFQEDKHQFVSTILSRDDLGYHRTRWMTKEYPPNYYANKQDEDKTLNLAGNKNSSNSKKEAIRKRDI